MDLQISGWLNPSIRGIGSRKPFLRHADHPVRHLFVDHPLPDHVGRASKERLPCVVAQNGDGLVSGRIVLGTKQAPECRTHTGEPEVVRRYGSAYHGRPWPVFGPEQDAPPLPESGHLEQIGPFDEVDVVGKRDAVAGTPWSLR